MKLVPISKGVAVFGCVCLMIIVTALIFVTSFDAKRLTVTHLVIAFAATGFLFGLICAPTIANACEVVEASFARNSDHQR